MNRVLQHLRDGARRREDADRTDGQLLECFVSRHDSAALAALVERHAPMVWGVCRRILRDHHDAEDAFQAAFLVLVRKAAAVVPRAMVANWLYGVARQTALKARADAAKRRGRERQVDTMPEPGVQPHCDLWPDLQPILDEELSHLPPKYRAAIVLCALEGKTRTEASRQLGCPEGTVAAWLARGRALLARRLAQRGLAISAGALAVGLSQQAATAAAPPAIVAATIGAVTAVAAGQAAASVTSAKVAALTEGVLKIMFLYKLARVLAIVLVVGILGAACGLGVHRTIANTPTDDQALPQGVRQHAAAAPRDLHPAMPVEAGELLPVQDGLIAADPRDAIAVRARVDGEIVRVMDGLQFGKSVKKGDVLVVVSSKALALKELDFIDALKHRQIDHDKLKRVTALYEQGAISEVVYQSALRDAEAGAAALERASRVLKIWGLADGDIKSLTANARKGEDLGRLAIRAPVDGTVVERNCNTGDLVDEKTVLLRLRPGAGKQPAGTGASDGAKIIKIGAVLEEVDMDNAMVTLTVAKKIVGKNGKVVLSQLANIWVATDAKILIGDKVAKLSDLRRKTGVWVRLGELKDGFRIVEITEMPERKQKG